MKTDHRPGQRGFALVAVLFVIAIISTFMAMLMYSASQRAHMAIRLTNRIKAKAMAEAGCEYGYAILSTNWAARYDPTLFAFVPPGAHDGAAGLASANIYENLNYNITVTAISSNAAVITATGMCGQASAEATIGVQDWGGTSVGGQSFDTEAFNYAILCGGSFTFRGCGTISSSSGDANFHANGQMDLAGNTHTFINLSSSSAIQLKKLTVGGNVTAPNIDKHKQTVIQGTETVRPVPAVAIPDIDLTPYYNWALSHGEVHNNFSTSTSYTPIGGILWVSGDFSASSHAEINGTVIATGSIMLSGAVDINPSATTAFGLVARDGNIKITSSGTLNGLIYAKTGNFEHTANGEIRGQIIVNGDIKKGGNSDIMAEYVQSIPTLPTDPPPAMLIGISAWQK